MIEDSIARFRANIHATLSQDPAEISGADDRFADPHLARARSSCRRLHSRGDALAGNIVRPCWSGLG